MPPHIKFAQAASRFKDTANNVIKTLHVSVLVEALHQLGTCSMYCNCFNIYGNYDVY